MFQAAQNNLVIKVKSKYVSNFDSITKLASIQQGANVHLEDLVNIVGEVISLPRSISKDRTHRGFSTRDIQVGDTAIFSFNVIYDFIQREPEDPLIYKNRVSIFGNEFWLADIRKVFAVVRDGEIIMVNGYVMAEPFIESKIIFQHSSKRTKGCAHSKLMHIGNNKGGAKNAKIKRGETIYFPPNSAAKYQINEKPFLILTQKHILGSNKDKVQQ